MNQLSVLLYWADTLPGLATAVACICTIGSLVSLILLGFHLVAKNDDMDYKGTVSFSTWLLPLLLILGILTNFVPSKDTFYMIAASEAGESALKTPEFLKLRRILNQALDGQLTTEVVVKKED